MVLLFPGSCLIDVYSISGVFYSFCSGKGNKSLWGQKISNEIFSGPLEIAEH